MKTDTTAEPREEKPIFSSPEPQRKELAGADIFLDWWKGSFYGVANELGALVSEAGEGNTIDKTQLISLLQCFNEAGLDVVKTENLYNFDGAKGYSA